ncbi:MAG TPA: type I-E CRISPR-associated protein Cse1/CasA [Sphaerochaeta sp.]|nr:type I-E CRISPR-associated protein Cse1/CasA [Spirochaetota bacterium]TAH57216.1 MAG: type I-E CRISPR-associated protein Cse1/CasA [Sphaerochaeta sp.]HOE90019.1 type I-E CRISPR-associated protein Cse1/CasA [Sphaerochaeta sp.]HPK63845.1 type I-E CRISPR-associated protein Cse1/CasA [Sphaerochaeta sp.]
MNNTYNLLDELWIPITGGRPISLIDAWDVESPRLLGGTAIQKLSVLKLLLAIAQRAYTPADTKEWERLGVSGLAKHCVEYLEKHRSLFFLYGDKPFLQYPILDALHTKKGEPLPVLPIGRPYHPDIPPANESITNQIQAYRIPTDAEKALFLISVMNHSLGGKRVTHIEPLSSDYPEKSVTAAPGPSIGNYVGYQHTFLLGSSIAETVYINLFTRETLAAFPQWADDPLIPPWEAMPESEDDANARRIQNGFMGTLVGLSRFVLLKDDGALFTEGLQYPSHKQGWREPFMTSIGADRVAFLDISKKPWRNITALLALSLSGKDSGVSCPQIDLLLGRAREVTRRLGIWSGGLKVRAATGDQSVKQDDDFIESTVWFESAVLGDRLFAELENQMKYLDELGTILYRSVRNYFVKLGMDPKQQSSSYAQQATARYWAFCETVFQQIVDNWNNPESLKRIHGIIRHKVETIYNDTCKKETARQLEAWVLNHPFEGRFVKKEE